MNNNGFWEFASKHPIITIFGIGSALSGVAGIVRAAKGVPEPSATVKVYKADKPKESNVIETDTTMNVEK